MREEGLERFLKAQENTYETALREIKEGKKRSHWMWYIFPQIKGLGYSEMAQYYGINGREEAEEYIAHPVLFSRLLEISNALLNLRTNNADWVFGYPDNLKLKSSMTLFYCVTNNNTFKGVLDKFFGGKFDAFTMRGLK